MSAGGKRVRNWVVGLGAGLAAAVVLTPLIAANADPRAARTGATPINGELYVDPETQVAEWVADHPGDKRTPLIRDRVATVPQARWFTEYKEDVTASVREYVGKAKKAGKIPMLVPYAIPHRDCGGASDGGAPTIAAYKGWIDRFAAGLGDSAAIVVLEPDALALEECLNATQIAERHDALRHASQVMHAKDKNVRVYYDAGHSDWNSAAETAKRLTDAGVKEFGDGFATNVSNYQRTEAEVVFGKKVLAALGDSSLKQVIDTSRNGNGPTADNKWCDPRGRALGARPTTDTGADSVAAYLWVKLPGEADGCAGDAGEFIPDLAYEMASAARPASPAPATSRAPRPSGRPSITPSVSAAPSGAPSSGAPSPSSATASAASPSCELSTSGDGKLRGTVTVTNEADVPLSNWEIEVTVPDGQLSLGDFRARSTGSDTSMTLRPERAVRPLRPGESVVVSFAVDVLEMGNAPNDVRIRDPRCAMTR